MKSKYNRLLAILLLVTAAGLGAASADTTTITYSYYTATSSADTSWVSPAGYTSVKAVNFGSAADTSFGGVTWLTSNRDGGPWGAGSYNEAGNPDIILSAPDKGWANNDSVFYSGGPALLNDGSWVGSLVNDGVDYRLEINGLTVGQAYLVQFVLADTRGAPYEGNTISIDNYSANISASADSTAYQFAYADGKFAVVTASFTPGAGDTNFAFRPLNGGGLQLNGIQVLTSADPFLTWINEPNWPGLADRSAGGDPDNDGIENLMEYVLQGGDPSVSTTGTLPTLDATGANFVFTYLRRTAATGTTQTFQYGSDLIGWTDVPVIDGGIVSITSPVAGIEQVVITVPKGTNTKLFGRLQVVK